MTGSARFLLGGLLGSLALGMGSAQAAYIGTLEFIEPTGVVAATDTIPVWLRFTLDPNSDPLAFDAYTDAPYGLVPDSYSDIDFIDENGFFRWGSMTDLTNAIVNTSFSCSGTFTNGCDPAAYEFHFHIPNYGDPSAPPGMVLRPELTLAPGESVDYLFGEFIPVGGSAPAGTYNFFGSALFIALQGTGMAVSGTAVDEDGNEIYDEDGNPVLLYDIYPNATYDIPLGLTPCGQTWPPDFNCAGRFERTVLPSVPVPAAGWLLLSGLGMLGAVRRRHQGSLDS